MAVVIPDLSASMKQQQAFLLDQNRKDLTLEVSWAGTPAGIIGLEVSNSSPDGLFASPGLWIPYSGITMPSQPSGSAGSFGLELIDFVWRWFRFSWTFTSGAGALSAVPNQK